LAETTVVAPRANRSIDAVWGGATVAVAFYSRRRTTANPSERNLAVCTVGTELLPAMDSATGLQENVVTRGGFFAGAALMLALQVLLTEYDYRRKLLGGGKTRR
jgi:hypothetical protein